MWSLADVIPFSFRILIASLYESIGFAKTTEIKNFEYFSKRKKSGRGVAQERALATADWLISVRRGDNTVVHWLVRSAVRLAVRTRPSGFHCVKR